MTHTINLQTYSRLVAEATPKVIETEDEYDRFLAIAERLTFQQEQTLEESALYDLVTMLLETYEAKHYPIDRSSAIEVLEHIIESSGIDRSELVEIFGSQESLERVRFCCNRASLQLQRKLFHNFASLCCSIYLYNIFTEPT